MADALQLRFDVLGGGDVAVREVAEVELHAGLEAPFERHLVDGDRRASRPSSSRRMEVIGRVQVGAVVGRQGDASAAGASPSG